MEAFEHGTHSIGDLTRLQVCVLIQGGTVTCWGNFSSTPAPIAGLTMVKKVAVANQHACAILQDGTVRCWGQNTSGELGNGDSPGTASTTPVAVVGVSGATGINDATAIASGNYHACALHANGTASCWGRRVDGRLGSGRVPDGFPPNPEFAPVTVVAPTP